MVLGEVILYSVQGLRPVEMADQQELFVQQEHLAEAWLVLQEALVQEGYRHKEQERLVATDRLEGMLRLRFLRMLALHEQPADKEVPYRAEGVAVAELAVAEER
ncbi:TPA: hypothetical protein DEB29_03525 [Candidatus Wolfebacteria bacterium]|nr:hypothetical protein [Candidatus Wolfebacteria bacterium]